MIEFIFFTLLLLALAQPKPLTQVAATIFVVSAIVHDQITLDSSVAVYHVSAATVDISVLFLITLLPRADFITRFLGCSCIISAGLNILGYAWWGNAQLSNVYDVIFMVFYAVLGACLIKGVISGGGKVSYLSLVYRSVSPGRIPPISLANQGARR